MTLYGIAQPAQPRPHDLLTTLQAPAVTPLPVLTKRATFFLSELMAAGANGITTIDYPGVRVGDAIFKLRRAGVEIETLREAHRGEFRGTHGRYVLRSKVVCQPAAPPPSASAERAHV